jgi:protein TonB
MKTAWLESVLFHLALAGSLFWLTTAHPVFHEAPSAGALTVALVGATETTMKADTSAPPHSPAAPAHRVPVKTARPRRPTPPVQPPHADTVTASASSEPITAEPLSVTESPSPSDVTAPDGAPASDTVEPVASPTDAVDTGRGTRDAGSAEPREGAGGTVTAEADPWPAYFAGVRDVVERAKHYPFSARLAGLEDHVTIAFSIKANGEAEQIRVTVPSRFPVLNNAAVDTIRRAGRFPAPPLRDHQSGVRVTVPLEFALHPHEEASPQ